MSSSVLRPLPLEPISCSYLNFASLASKFQRFLKLRARGVIICTPEYIKPWLHRSDSRYKSPQDKTALHNLSSPTLPPPTNHHHTPCDGDARLNGGERRPTWRIAAQLDKPNDSQRAQTRTTQSLANFTRRYVQCGRLNLAWLAWKSGSILSPDSEPITSQTGQQTGIK